MILFRRLALSWALLLTLALPATAQQVYTEAEFAELAAGFADDTTAALFPGLSADNAEPAAAFVSAILADEHFLNVLYTGVRIGRTALITHAEFLGAITALIETSLVNGAALLPAEDQEALIAHIASVPTYLTDVDPGRCATWMRGGGRTNGVAVIMLQRAGAGPGTELQPVLDLATRAILASVSNAPRAVAYTSDELNAANNALTAAMAAEAAAAFNAIAGGNVTDAAMCTALAAQFGAYATLADPVRSHAITVFFMRRL